MDIQKLDNSVATKANMSVTDKAYEAAKGFETLLASMMVSAMRKTIMDSEFFPKSTAMELYTEMLDKQYSEQISEMGNLGIADQILAQISDDPMVVAEALSNSALKHPLHSFDNLNSKLRSFSMDFTPVNKVNSEKAIIKGVDRWDTVISEAAEKYDLDFNLIKAVIRQESNGNPMAVSHAGAKGLMQLMDGTARELGVVNSFDPVENVMGGARYLKKMLSLFGSEELALASYNAGPGTVKKFGGVPPYRETKDYIIRVQKFREYYKNAVLGK